MLRASLFERHHLPEPERLPGGVTPVGGGRERTRGEALRAPTTPLATARSVMDSDEEEVSRVDALRC